MPAADEAATVERTVTAAKEAATVEEAVTEATAAKRAATTEAAQAERELKPEMIEAWEEQDVAAMKRRSSSPVNKSRQQQLSSTVARTQWRRGG